MHQTPDDVRQTLGRALGRVPSGVYILTASHAGRAGAMLASWIQQCSFQPPAVSVALRRDRSIRPLIDASGRFVVSVVAKADTRLMKKYARGLGEDEDLFAEMATAPTPSGGTYLADAIAWLDCRVLQVVDFEADHELCIAEATAGGLLRDEPPFTHVRGNGFHY